MRLLFPLLALPLLNPAASTAQTPAPTVGTGEMPIISPNANVPGNCPATTRYEATKRGGKLELQKLNQLPMADGYKAVLRHIDRCPAPIIVGYGFGSSQR